MGCRLSPNLRVGFRVPQAGSPFNCGRDSRVRQNRRGDVVELRVLSRSDKQEFSMSRIAEIRQPPLPDNGVGDALENGGRGPIFGADPSSFAIS